MGLFVLLAAGERGTVAVDRSLGRRDMPNNGSCPAPGPAPGTPYQSDATRAAAALMRRQQRKPASRSTQSLVNRHLPALRAVLMASAPAAAEKLQSLTAHGMTIAVSQLT